MSTGASTYIFPQTAGTGTGTWLAGAWNAIREEFIILAPFGSVDEPVVKSQTKDKFDPLALLHVGFKGSLEGWK